MLEQKRAGGTTIPDTLSEPGDRCPGPGWWSGPGPPLFVTAHKQDENQEEKDRHPEAPAATEKSTTHK